jgi:seipin
VLYPVARTCIGPLTTGTKYDYNIDMTLPETPANLAAGNFMIRLFLYSDGVAAPENPHFPPLGTKATRTTIAHRSVSMRYRSGLRRTLYSVVFAIPIALGISWFDEYQTISTTLIQDLAHTGDSGEICVAISVNNPRVQIYEGSITIIAKLEGLRYWCYHWFLTCFLIGSSIFFGIYGFTALGLFGIIYTKMRHEKAREDMRRELAEDQKTWAKTNGDAASLRKSSGSTSSDGDEDENEPVKIRTPQSAPEAGKPQGDYGKEVKQKDSDDTEKDSADPYDSDSAAGTGLKSLGPAVGLNSPPSSDSED